MKDKCIFLFLDNEGTEKEGQLKYTLLRAIENNIDVNSFDYKKSLDDTLLYRYKTYEVKEVSKQEFETKRPISKHVSLDRFFFAYVYDKTL
jgi:hypothetical protein